MSAASTSPSTQDRKPTMITVTDMNEILATETPAQMIEFHTEPGTGFGIRGYLFTATDDHADVWIVRDEFEGETCPEAFATESEARAEGVERAAAL